ncbi:carbon-nitrogen hydrolase family protein [Subtercola frigoramans]|uniref:Amidohydrolase n=1 Tax=Subtercola frigoramans TaxID=120298 RepID=A0ABS2L3X5_9MICO|nr:carbon-nitrogen hydrolase family protein [Subtercola frigoramans]MBM7471805.1 putative amidohydrolase [Subtercola frigoramans]
MNVAAPSGVESNLAVTVGVAVAQFAPGADGAANLEEMGMLVTVAVARGAELVVFPEYSSHFSSPLGPNALAAAQSLDGPFVNGLRDLALRSGVHVVAGIVESGDDNHYYNTLVAVDPSGELVARYRKVHLYDAFGQHESEWMRAGAIEHPETFVVGDFTVGLQTCYDLRFPESTRWLVDAGVDLVLVPAEWVPGPAKERHWTTLLEARAIENTVYVAAADHTVPGGVGLSMVMDPTGVPVAMLGAEAGVAVAFISRARLEQVRRVNPALDLRRFAVTPRHVTEG